VTLRLIAIDGAAGSGKSTLARSLAASLGLPYINTGLMYRALTAAALHAGVSIDDERGLAVLTEGLRFSLGGTNPPELKVEGWSGVDLVTLEVEASVVWVRAVAPSWRDETSAPWCSSTPP
jgi:cytidylate kinase